MILPGPSCVQTHTHTQTCWNSYPLYFKLMAHSSISPKTSKRRLSSERVLSARRRPTYKTRLSSWSLKAKQRRGLKKYRDSVFSLFLPLTFSPWLQLTLNTVGKPRTVQGERLNNSALPFPHSFILCVYAVLLNPLSYPLCELVRAFNSPLMENGPVGGN